MNGNKTKKAHKILLMSVVCLLVAAISVSVTLAYLTTQTAAVTNTFTASGDMTGQIHEPKFPNSGTVNYVPGKAVDKDPLVQNTSGYDIYTGLRLDYYINWTGDTYYRVPFKLFENYFEVVYNTGTTNGWTDVTSSVNAKSGNVNASGLGNDIGASWSRYYTYGTVLTEKSTTTVSGTYADNGSDCSIPVFTKVTPSSDIQIMTLKAGETYEAKLHYGDYKNKTYPQMNFKIVITGFGVKKDESVTTPALAQPALITTMSNAALSTEGTNITAALVDE